ncbi:ribosomal RNA processing protein 1 homolog B-like isoform X2 [Actinia tenebrosa]|nr:ribosomal RNA processing protein 1 homolog B-like isoform X2 [Actinia tenebrosa]
MHKEWHGIDRLRLDKFYLLVRMFIKENLEFLKRNSWEPSVCSRLCDIYKDGPLHPSKENVPAGMKLHLCSVFLNELSNVANEKVSSEIISSLLEPFFVLAAETKSQVVSRAVKDGVLEKLLDIEEKRLRKENEEDEKQDEKKQILQINCQAIADKLFSLGSDREILGRNRNLLYLYAKKFKKAVSDDTEGNEKGRKRKLEQEKETEKLPDEVVPNKKSKKKQEKLRLNGTASSEIGEKENEPEVTQKDGKKKKQKRTQKGQQDTSEKEVPAPPKMKKKPTKKVLDINGYSKDDIINKESSVKTSNGLQEDETNNNEVAAQGKSSLSEKIVEKTIKELRSQVSSAQDTEKTPVKKKKKQELQGDETPFAAFTKTVTPPAFFKEAVSRTEPRKAKTSKLTCPNSEPQNSKKKVRIHLHKNKAQSTSDYVKSVTSSPDIPFDASRTPEFSLLKTKSLTKSKPVIAAKKRTPSNRSKAVDFF